MVTVKASEVRRFIIDCLVAAGAGSKPACQQAELLIQADRLGHPEQGLFKLEKYVKEIKSGACLPNNEPKILKESKATAWVDANNVLGATASHFGMDLAIYKAFRVGVGLVAVKGSNHNGMAGLWAKKAADKGLIGLAFSNSSPLMAPTRAKKAALGTNPIAIVAPGNRSDLFFFDTATSAISFGKVQLKYMKKEKLPSGCGQGPDGKETLDPEVVIKNGSLMPLGGEEATSGYKGFALAAMVEILTGFLAGSCYGHHIKGWNQTGVDTPANLGQSFIAINPDCFTPRFQDRMSKTLKHWRNLEPMDKTKPVLAPGDLEMTAAFATDCRGTVIYWDDLMKHSDCLAAMLKVPPMKPMESGC